MLQSLAKQIAQVMLYAETAQEKRVGYKLTFKDLPDNWIKGYALINMTLTWRSYGLPLKGLNYFTVGAPKKGVSTRFDSENDLYQSWLGGYIFQSKKPLHWHSDGYLRLAEADQKGWLKRFGVISPAMDFGKLTKIKEMIIEGKDAALYSWAGVTRSDVGTSSHSLLAKVMMDGMADMMNTLTPGLKLTGRNFIPHKSKRTPYEELLISGYMILVNIDSKRKAVLYVCMVGDNKPDRALMRKLITENLQLTAVSK